MQALERVGGRLAALVGDVEELGERVPRLLDIAAPHEPLHRRPAPATAHVVGALLRELTEAVAEIVDGSPTERRAPTPSA